MRFDKLTGRHIGPFESIDLDLTAIPGILFAVTGPNGGGKTTLLELLTGGTLFRECENRGSLVGLATARDSFIEGRVVNGQSYVVRHEIDGIARTSESVVKDSAGADMLPDRKCSGFDAWAAKHFPSPQVLYASTVAPQKSKGLLEMTRGDRMAVLLRALGCEKLEEQKKRATDAAGEAGAKASLAQARLSDEKGRGLDVPEAGRAHEQARHAQAIALHSEAAAAVDLRLAREQSDLALRHNAERDRLALERQRSVDIVLSTERRAQELRARRDTAKRTLLGQEDVQGAVDRLADLDRDLAQAREALALSIAEQKIGEASGREAARVLMAAQDVSRALATRIQTGRDKIASARFIEVSATELPKRKAEHDAAAQRVTQLEQEIEGLRKTADEGADARANYLRLGLQWYADANEGEASPGEHAKASLAHDDRWLQDRAARPKAIADKIDELHKARVLERDLQKRILELTQAQTRLEALSEWKILLSTLEAEAKIADATLAEREILLGATNQQTAGIVLATMSAQTRVDNLVEQRAPLAAIANKAPAIATAQAQLSEIERTLADVEKELGKAVLARDEILRTDLPDRKPEPDVPSFDRAWQSATSDLAKAETAEALAKVALEQALASSARIETLEGELLAAREEQADWTRIASDIEGVKLAEIDAAGPALTELANDLLHSCAGPRFTIVVDTQRVDAKGKKMLDGVDIRVIDSGPKPREGDGKTFSPGEQVLLNEALSLALAVLYCDRTGVEGATIVRDETGSALDSENAIAYVGMLRRAAAKVRASRVLFVSHSRELWELADARIDVTGGRIEVRT